MQRRPGVPPSPVKSFWAQHVPAVSEEMIENGFALDVPPILVNDVLEAGAKSFIIEPVPCWVLWDTDHGGFIIYDMRAEHEHRCRPIYPEVFDMPYHNSAMRERFINSYLYSNQLQMDCALKVSRVSGIEVTGPKYFMLHRVMFAPNFDFVEMALMLFVDRYIQKAYEHQKCYFFILKPRPHSDKKKRRRVDEQLATITTASHE